MLAEHTREFATTARFFVGNGRNREYGDIQNELDESFVVNLRMAPVYAQKYWIAWLGLFKPNPERVRTGKTVIVKVSPPV